MIIITVLLVLSKTDIIANKLHYSIKMLSLVPCLSILMQKSVMLNTGRIVPAFLAEEWIRSEISVLLGYYVL